MYLGYKCYILYIYMCRLAAGITQVDRHTWAHVYFIFYLVYLGYECFILYILFIYMCRLAAGITQVERHTLANGQNQDEQNH